MLVRNWPGALRSEDFFLSTGSTLTVANMLNDLADFAVEPRPIPNVNPGDQCSQLRVESANPHDALGDAVATAVCYRNLVTTYRVVRAIVQSTSRPGRPSREGRAFCVAW
jgi:hypothetical protein